MDHRYFDFAALPSDDRYKILSGCILPRPIALVTTRGRDGHANAAPFSFFGVLDHDPAIVALGIGAHPDGRRKDTVRNIHETGEFMVHIPDLALARAVEIAATPVDYGVDELALAMLDHERGKAIGSPRIIAAPVAMECVLHTTVPVSNTRDILIGKVSGLFIRAQAVNERLHVDPAQIDAIGRLGGRTYCTTRDLFAAPRI
ncbi:flavin reductase family protein [Paracoccus sp. MKU1]|uniref:flavin reductase family protein n=1 Tax=Paracoccus sp. MKU1 TaxID=1745182 RepID=UPI0007190ECA|nr:flavin reductase family protein [Paracoccus sp. MKU1]KRW95230.1 hypothetical protein AQY21_15635 [Paracoccus sp. MKU1]